METLNNDNRIHICYCGNKRVFPMILLSALSVIKHTKAPITIYLATMSLTEEDAAYEAISAAQGELLEELMQGVNGESRVEVLNLRDAYLRLFANSKNGKNSYTPYAQLRLLLGEFAEIDKLIYLDTDVMCCSDLMQLWEIDVTGHEFAAVKDYMGTFWINAHYCNSGVLLLNMRENRESDFLCKVIEYIKTHKMMMPDQSALNRLAKNKLILPRKFNEQRAIQKDTVLKHFCKGIKWFPFFHVYNYKQTQRDKVHKKLKIYDFDDIYAQFDEIALTHDIGE